MIKPLLYFVDDEANILSAAKRLFRVSPIELRCFEEARNALESFVSDKPAAIVTDYRMPGMSGVELLERCRAERPGATRILLTGYVDLEAVVEAINRGSVYRFMSKPWKDEELRATALEGVAESLVGSATKALSAYLGSLIGVGSSDEAFERLELFLGEESGMHIEKPSIVQGPPPDSEGGGLVFSCPIGGDGELILVRIEADYAPLFAGAELGENLRSIIDTALRGFRLATESAEARASLVTLSERDPLSGLFNRRAMTARIENECARQNRFGFPFSVLLMDIDSFKGINDRYGHGKGDEVIAGIGRIILRTCRTVDIPARIGGDEFLVALPHTEPKDAVHLAERIRGLAAELGKELDLEAGLTLSIGLSATVPGCKDIEEVISAADEAMYAVKRAGKNGIGS
jgi:diguanylate cyclase (GGDEF)-like protein